jgi:predicted N-acetyltransferase YhbS
LKTSASEITIRQAALADVPRIIELYRGLVITQSDVEHSAAPSPERYREVLRQIQEMPGHELLVAERDGQVLGTLVMLIVPNLSHQGLPWALVENVVVDPACRSQGIGGEMMRHAIARAEQAGCYRIILTSHQDRTEAHRFYQSLGLEGSSIGFRRYF